MFWVCHIFRCIFFLCTLFWSCVLVVFIPCPSFSSMGLGSSSPEDMDQLEETKQMVQKLIDSDEIVIFSKTTCPYCKSAKGVSFVFEYALRVVVNYL